MCAGVIYGLADRVWMLYLAMSVCGFSGTLGPATLHTYMGEMGTRMDDVRKKKGEKPRKFIVYIVYSFVFNGGYIITYGES